MSAADDYLKVLTFKKKIRVPSPWQQSLLVAIAVFLGLPSRDRWWVLASGEVVLQLQSRHHALQQWTLDGWLIDPVWLQAGDVVLLTVLKLILFLDEQSLAELQQRIEFPEPEDSSEDWSNVDHESGMEEV